MIMFPRDINITDGIEEMIENFNFTLGLGALVKLDEYGPCIAYLIQLQVFPKLCGNSGIPFSEKIDPNGRINKDLIGHGDSFPMCLRSEVCLRDPESSRSS